jgi:hypothetical protein
MPQLGRRCILALFGAGLLVGSGCLSPTLPLPPPEEPTEIQKVGDRQYLLTGSIPEPGVVETLNARNGLTFGQVTDGPYSFEITALPGDQIQLWYSTGQRTSDSVLFEIPQDDSPPDAGSGDAAARDAGGD